MKGPLGMEAAPGMRVSFVPNDSVEKQANWGANKNPDGLLDPSATYVIERVEVHSWHTKIWLEGASGLFNSVSFIEVGA